MERSGLRTPSRTPKPARSRSSPCVRSWTAISHRDSCCSPTPTMSTMPSSRHHTQHPPVIRSLDRTECEALLARNHIGRVAYALHDRVSITPLHYVFLDGWLYGRTSHGAKIGIVAHNHWVAFEVDEVARLFDWRSVVVHGGGTPTIPRHPPSTRCGIAALRHCASCCPVR